jgi:hypothetical protein
MPGNDPLDDERPARLLANLPPAPAAWVDLDQEILEHLRDNGPG